MRGLYAIRNVHGRTLRLIGGTCRREARVKANAMAREIVRGLNPQFHDKLIYVERRLQSGAHDDQTIWHMTEVGRVYTSYRDC